jgi:hypothetical protein
MTAIRTAFKLALGKLMRVHASSTMLIVVLLIVVTITVVTPKNSIEVN